MRERFQSRLATGADFVARVLGTHGICVRQAIDPAKARLLHLESNFWIVRDFSCDVGIIDLENAL